jgi:hypothetical protein
VSIRPPSEEALKQWASTRPLLFGAGLPHILTKMVKSARVKEIVTPEKK